MEVVAILDALIFQKYPHVVYLYHCCIIDVLNVSFLDLIPPSSVYHSFYYIMYCYFPICCAEKTHALNMMWVGPVASAAAAVEEMWLGKNMKKTFVSHTAQGLPNCMAVGEYEHPKKE